MLYFYTNCRKKNYDIYIYLQNLKNICNALKHNKFKEEIIVIN